MLFDDDVIKKAILNNAEEHDVILNDLEKFDKLLQDENFDEVFKGSKNILSFFDKEMKEHFLQEEEVLFPAVLLNKTDNKTISLVLILQKEHGVILEKVEFLKKEKNNYDNYKDSNYITLLQKIIVELMEHSKKEMKELYPLLENLTH
ncbi:MAG: hypothetical protein ACD_79C01375G0004 [uncultured bacterium]|nr:MAG: hypothetical protein ACD_79C01375G0004 [uncultured bacterium]